MVTMRPRSFHARTRGLRSFCCPSFRFSLFCFLILAATAVAETDPPAAKDATAYPAVDFHSKEQVAIAAEPCETAEKCKIFQVDYLKYRFMPIRIIVTNMGDHPISLSDARIFFISSAGDKVPAAEPEDVERRVRPKDSRGRDIPIGPIKVHTKGSASDDKIQADFDHFEYAAIAVEPHTTRAGFLFYDMEGLGDTPLRGAKLNLRELRNSDGDELFFFEIPFDKYLEAKH
jgi:hypothetical protein